MISRTFYICACLYGMICVNLLTRVDSSRDCFKYMYMYQLDFCAVRACVHIEGYLRTTHENNWSEMSALI